MNYQKKTSGNQPKGTVNNNHKIPSHYDPHLIPAETAARETREGSHFGQVKHDDVKDTDHVHTRDGYTSDQEGLFNNYAVEPPMYTDQSSNSPVSDWKKSTQKPVVWGILMLFAIGLCVLLTIMTLMPYGSTLS